MALDELQKAADGRLDVIEGDALKTDLIKLAKFPRAIVANLPYNIGTELLIKWLRQVDAFRSITLMFQKEVADRIVAKPGQQNLWAIVGDYPVLLHGGTEVRYSRACLYAAAEGSSQQALCIFTPRADRPEDVGFEVIELVTAAGFWPAPQNVTFKFGIAGWRELVIARGWHLNPDLQRGEFIIAGFLKIWRMFSLRILLI